MGVQRGSTAVKDRPSTRTRTAPSAEEYAAEAETEGDSLPAEPEVDTVDRSSSVVKSGWAAAKQNVKDTSKAFADDWSPQNGETLMKFLEDDPFAACKQHWVDEIYRAKGGKASWTCREDEGCPLCGRGHKPRALNYFNAVPIRHGTEMLTPEIVALKAGPALFDILEEAANSFRGPLSRHYWVLGRKETKTGGRTKVSYTMDAVKADELADVFELDPVEIEKSFDGLELWTKDIVTVPTQAVLKDIADKWLSKD